MVDLSLERIKQDGYKVGFKDNKYIVVNTKDYYKTVYYGNFSGLVDFFKVVQNART